MYDKFLSPIQIGSVPLRSRSVMTSMGTGYADDGGYVSDRLIAYHRERALGGIGMNTVERSPVHETSAISKCVGSYDDAFIPGLSKLAAAIKEQGGVACIQLQHFGRQMSSRDSGLPLLAPSPIPCAIYQEMPKEMTHADIQMIVEAFGAAALRVKKAGFDMIELQGAHGYLIGSFMSSFSNKRVDEYGGSFINRMRFPLEVISEVRRQVGHDFPLVMRISADEHVEGGIELEEAVRMAQLLEAAGIDALNVSQGNHYAISYETPNIYMPEMTHVECAAEIKRHVQVPVIVAGRITSPELAEHILDNDMADLIGFGRVLLADPHFVNKARQGRADEIIRCVSCNQGCVNRLYSGTGSPSCVYNPKTGRELEFQLIPASTKKHVLVIGGGPAGLEASRTLQERGHEVTLFEKSGGLGGQLILAGAAPKKKILIDAALKMGYRAYKSGIDIQLYTAANKDNVLALHPDEIVVASGSEPVELDIPGSDEYNLYEARDILAGDQYVKEETIAIIGGGSVGIETAELLSAMGKRIILIEMTNEIGKDLGFQSKPYVMSSLQEAKVDIYVNSTCVSFTGGKLVLERDGRKQVIIGVGALVLAVGAKSDRSLEAWIQETGIPYHVIGDAKKAGNMMDAILAGAEVGRMI